MAFRRMPGCRRWVSLALLITWFWVAVHRLYRLPTDLALNSSYSNLQSSLEGGTEADAFNFAPVDSESIKSICSDTEWNPDVVFTCENSVGGVGNIRNSILNCVRYAISAGAGLVIPRIIVRDSEDIAKIRTAERREMDYIFDTTHFVLSLRLSCPSLRLYDTIDEIAHLKKPVSSLSLLPESLVNKIPASGLEEPEAWRGKFYAWLEQKSPHDVTGPTIVALNRSYLQYPIYSDGEGFALAFGGVLKFRADVRVLATKTILKLAREYSLPGDLSQPVLENAFLGAHLRTEKDAMEGWPAEDWIFSEYKKQAKLYLEQALLSNISTIYVASGDVDEVTKFSRHAQRLNITATTKFELLEGGDREELGKLAWDQQALVDFLVMLKASKFVGIPHSSFAWTIALQRHKFAKKRNHLDGPHMLSDGLSLIYGRAKLYPEYAACLWP